MSWATLIGFGEQESKAVEETCRGISQKDPTFKYRIGPMFEKFRSKYPYVLVVESQTRSQAVKRGLLLTRKYLAGYNLLFWVADIGEEGEG
jgi:hypothetical protein